MSKRKISRRHFLGEASCAAIGSSTFLSTALNLAMINTVAARPHIIENIDDYKAIVCILLAGGADSHNILIPRHRDRYQECLDTRTSLALNHRPDPIPGSDPDLLYDYYIPLNGVDYDINGGMTGVQQLFNSNKISFISNISTLIEPIADKVAYQAGGYKLPLGLYSHSDQIMQWQNSLAQDRSAVGVGGKIADLLNDTQSIPEISMNISLDGKNRFQSGNQALEYAIKNNVTQNNIGVEGLPSWYSNSGFLNQTKDQVAQNILEAEYGNLFQKTYGTLTNNSYEAIEIMQAALGKVPPINTPFSGTSLSQVLFLMAKMMSVQADLGKNRQMFFTTFRGWDHHDNVIGSQSGMLPVLSNALVEFYAALVELGLEEKVTVITVSDFARTLTSDDNSSDHAWGSNQMIMGGAAKRWTDIWKLSCNSIEQQLQFVR